MISAICCQGCFINNLLINLFELGLLNWLKHKTIRNCHFQKKGSWVKLYKLEKYKKCLSVTLEFLKYTKNIIFEFRNLHLYQTFTAYGYTTHMFKHIRWNWKLWNTFWVIYCIFWGIAKHCRRLFMSEMWHLCKTFEA